MPVCSVPGCKKEGGFQFPSDPEMNMKWRQAIQRADPSHWTPSESSVVCDKHFKREDFKVTLMSQASLYTGQRRRRVLKPNAVPIFDKITTTTNSPSLVPNPFSIPMNFPPKSAVKEEMLMVVSLGTEGHQSKKFTIDKVNLIRHGLYGIQIQCWECGHVLKNPNLLQTHLIQKHGKSQCPGKRCGGFRVLPNTKLELSTHLENHHYWTSCLKGHVVHLRQYESHLLNGCSDDSGLEVLSNDSISFPIDEVPLKKVNKSQHGTYYLNGELCTVDGINFCIIEKDFSIIVDCPLCKRGIGLSLLGSHMTEDHGKSNQVPCLSPQCPQKSLEIKKLKQHILDEHTSLRCRDCDCPLTIVEVLHHLKYRCSSRIKDTGPLLPRVLPTIACPFCRSEVLHLNEHIQKKHAPRIECFICYKMVRKSKISLHMLKYHEDHEDLYYKKCHLCNEDVLKLDNHMEAMHANRTYTIGTKL